MPKTKPTKSVNPKPAAGSTPDGFINLPVSKQTRAGLHLLKDAMGVGSQAEVVERLVAISIAIHIATR